jgi:hypothetical protein
MRGTRLWAALLLAGAVVLTGCDDGDDDTPGAPGDGGSTDSPQNLDAVPGEAGEAGGSGMLIMGRVTAGATAAALAGARVTVTVDRDGNGTTSAAESSQGMTDANGSYAVSTGVAAGQTVVVKIAKDGYAPIFRVVTTASDTGAVTMNAEAAATATMSCAAGTCTGETNGLSLGAVPEGMQASGMAFNPVTQTDKFPGPFEDSTGAILKSGVFAAIELKDASGQQVSALPSPMTLKMQVPADTWAIVADTKPGTDRIEVPLYSFNETVGVWVADGEGYLEDAMGMPIPEASLAQIRARSFGGSVIATGSIQHASYWNVDWPLRTHGCLTGVVVDAQDRPVAGATLFSGGVDYTANYRAYTTGADGRFCLDVLRGEAAGEDVDGNGKMGDKHEVTVHVEHQQHLYLLGTLAPGASEAVCGGGCTDVGRLALIPAKEVKTALEGHWAGDWGDMVLRKVGDEYWGVYVHDTGTVVLRASPDGVYRGWWSEIPSRMAPSDAGEVEFRFSWTGTALGLDGQWRYGATGAFKPDWDLMHVTTPVPAGLEERFTDTASFKRHP